MTVRVFLESNDSFTAASNNLVVSASGGGSETMRILAGVTGVQLDANFERTEFLGSLADYQFLVVPGSGVQVQTTSGVIVTTLPSLNQAVTLAFSDGSIPLVQTGGSTFAFGGTGGQAIAVSPSSSSSFTAAGLGAAFNSNDTSNTSGANITINAAGTTTDSGDSVNTNYQIIAGSYTHTIDQFGAGDVLNFFTNAALTVLNDSNQTDGIQQLTATDATTSAVTTLTLTGLTTAEDQALFNTASFDSVFGTGTIVNNSSIFALTGISNSTLEFDILV